MIAKMVSKLLSGDKDMKPGASQDLGMSRALSTALGALGPQEHGTHPHHVLLAMNDELKQQIGAPPSSPPPRMGLGAARLSCMPTPHPSSTFPSAAACLLRLQGCQSELHAAFQHDLEGF